MTTINTTPLPRDQTILRIAGLAIIAAFFTAARVYNPFESELVVCQLKSLTGYDCPTCGLTRSVSLLMHFQFADSLAYHPLGAVVAAALLLAALKFTIELFLRKEITIAGGTSAVKIGLLTITSLAALHWIAKVAFGLQLFH